MQLNHVKVPLGKIAINPLNPRNQQLHQLTQEELFSQAMSMASTTELLTSMQEQLLWVNQIVIISREEFCEIYSIVGDSDELQMYDYVVIEGSTRICCLKSGEIADVDKQTTIPVSLVDFEENHTTLQKYQAVMLLQGISNVMVVKEWSDLSKVIHIHNMYQSQLQFDVQDSEKKVRYELGAKLGVSRQEVTKMLHQYILLKCIGILNNKQMKENWVLTDAFPNSAYSKGIMGFNADMTYDTDRIQQGLRVVLDVLNLAIRQGIEIRKMRDYFNNYFQRHRRQNSSAEKVINELGKLLEDKSSVECFMTALEASKFSEESYWINQMDSLYKSLSHMPEDLEATSQLLSKIKELVISLNLLKDQIENNGIKSS